MRPSHRILWPLALTLLAACGANVGPDGTPNSSGFADEGEAITGGKCPKGTTTLGIDVSSWQGTVNWTSVKNAGIKFAIARVSDGSYQDADFARNWSGIKSVGLLRGAYQFFEPSQDALTQANLVISKVGKLGAGDLPVMLDMEKTGGQSAATITAKIHTWVNAIEKGTGKTPFIYTGAYFWDDNVKSSDFANLALDVAWYGTNCPGVPNAWNSHSWTFHQYTSSYRVAGISGNVDADVYNGTLASLEAWAGGSAASSGDPVNDNGPLARNVNDRIEIVARGTNGELYHDWEGASGQYASGWSGLYSLGGNAPADQRAAMLRNKNDKEEAFVRGTNGHVYESAQTATYGWTAWTELAGDGAFTGSVAVATNHGGLTEIFARGNDGAIWHNAEVASEGAWTGWTSLGGEAAADASPTVGRNADGRLEVFVRGTDGALYHAAQAPSTFAWGEFVSLSGNLVGNFSVVSNVNNLLEVFGSTADGKTWHLWQDGKGGYTAWAALPVVNSAGGTPTVTRNLDGRLEFFVRGTDNALWHTWQNTDFTWTFNQNMGGDFRGNPVSLSNSDGRIEVFAVNAAGTLVHDWQTSAGGSWSGFGDPLGGALAPF